MLSLLEKKASDNWKLAYKLSNEGKFLESSERCLIASKLFLRASNKSTDMKKAKLFYSYSFMLQASKQEAIANNALKKQNDAKGSIRPFELAANALKQAIESYPNREDTETLNRWQAQQQYYLGHNFQSQGIFLLDSEKYQEALKLFNQAEEIFNEANKFATNTNDKALIKLIDKSIAEAKGYIGMCKTVLD